MDFLDDEQRERLEAGNERIDRDKEIEDRRVERINEITETVKDLKAKVTPSVTGMFSKAIEAITGEKPTRLFVRGAINPMIGRTQSRRETRERIYQRFAGEARTGLGDFNAKSATALGVGALISYIIIRRFS